MLAAELLTRLFPLWAIAFSVLAWWQPQWFAEGKALIVPLLALVMFGMGLTLRLDDFKRVAAMPGAITLGMVLQYSIMPLSALLIARALQLDPALTLGMILLGSCPGGTASNVICYLAKGDVALSISLTAVSTLLSVVLTPAITLLLADTSVQVPAASMLLSILYMVILPVALGTALNHLAGPKLRPLSALFPAISVLAIVVIIAIIVALNQASAAAIAITLIVAVVLHNAIGLTLGYALAALAGLDITSRRTLAIEVGMQNSGLAVALAFKYFGAASALPGALFSIWHNLSGSLLAAVMRSR